MKLFGRVPDEAYRDTFVASLPVQHIPARMVNQLAGIEVRLWEAKDKVDSTWRREAQGIGDCVSWGCELACTCILWNLAAKGLIKWPGRVDPTTIYGGCRCEVHGKVPGPMGNGDGAAGSWAADWVTQWGVLLQQDYSKETGNSMHDLTRYSAERAKHMGYYGCGGQKDDGKLDAIAKLHPCASTTLVRNFNEAAAAISAGCPITVASGVGYEGDRNNEGVCRAQGSWPHQMCYLGVGWLANGDGYLYQFNSWGPDSWRGPYPGVTDPNVMGCSCRVRQDDVERQLREQDSFALSPIENFTQDLYDFDKDLIV